MENKLTGEQIARYRKERALTQQGSNLTYYESEEPLLRGGLWKDKKENPNDKTETNPGGPGILPGLL